MSRGTALAHARVRTGGMNNVPYFLVYTRYKLLLLLWRVYARKLEHCMPALQTYSSDSVNLNYFT